jgi:hypothetical protein
MEEFLRSTIDSFYNNLLAESYLIVLKDLDYGFYISLRLFFGYHYGAILCSFRCQRLRYCKDFHRLPLPCVGAVLFCSY